MGKILVNKQQDRTFKEAVIAYFKVFFRYFSGGIEKPQNTSL
jgi:hypothetical protein